MGSSVEFTKFYTKIAAKVKLFLAPRFPTPSDYEFLRAAAKVDYMFYVACFTIQMDDDDDFSLSKNQYHY